MTSAIVVDAWTLAFHRGGKMFGRGELEPTRPADDDNCLEENGALWLGFMLARFRAFEERRRVRRLLDLPDED